MESPTRKTKEYSKFELILGNLAIILWIVLGATAMWLFYPIVAIVFFVSASFLVFYELGKHGCQTCYYCKTCTIGIGKLPAPFFSKGGTANVNKRAMKQFPFVYFLLSLVPLVFIFISILETITIIKVTVLIFLLTFSIYSGVIRRKSLL